MINSNTLASVQVMLPEFMTAMARNIRPILQSKWPSVLDFSFSAILNVSQPLGQAIFCNEYQFVR